MAAMFMLVSVVLFGGTGAAVMNAAHNTTIELTCTGPHFPPLWIRNGILSVAEDGYITHRNGSTGELIGKLIINGNRTCGTFHLHCILHSGEILIHNITLTVAGRLPFPENVNINESNGTLFIEWIPPYSAVNTNSSIMHITPHITQYTVYIIDKYTGNYMDKVNVTERYFRRSISDDNSCPMYGVTAWNSGGEGDMSVPLPGYLPRIPNSIAAEHVDVRTASGTLDVHLRVTDTCAVRIPNSFLVTVMSTAREIVTVKQEHQPEHRDATIHIILPHDQTVDECNLIVRIIAGNSAGMSSPTEITVGCPTTDYSTDPTTATTTTASPGSNTPTDLVDPNQPGDSSITYIAIGSAVGAVVIVAISALLLILLWKCKRPSKVEPPVENFYTDSPSLGGPPVYQPDLPPVHSPPAVVYVATESPPSRTSSIESSGSDRFLLPPPKPAGIKSGVQVTTGMGGVAVSLQSSTTSSGPQAPEGNPQLLYARVDPAKHSRPQPPANDNQVQYAQLQYQDQQ